MPPGLFHGTVRPWPARDRCRLRACRSSGKKGHRCLSQLLFPAVFSFPLASTDPEIVAARPPSSLLSLIDLCHWRFRGYMLFADEQLLADSPCDTYHSKTLRRSENLFMRELALMNL